MPHLHLRCTLSPRSRAILSLVAAGHTYDQILQAHPDFSEQDIFDAAEALQIGESLAAPPDDQPAEAYSVEVMRQQHSQAYAAWTQADDDLLKELFRTGHTIADLAERFGRNQGAIRSRIKKLGLDNR